MSYQPCTGSQNFQKPIPTYTLAEYEAAKNNIPEGSLFNISDDKTQVTNVTNNKYSTEEIIVGEWIDGKSIYRKVITSESFLPDRTVLVNNVDELINASGSQNWIASNAPFTYPYYEYSGNTTRWLRPIVENNNLIHLVSGFTSSQVNKHRIIVEYTKTTD